MRAVWRRGGDTVGILSWLVVGLIAGALAKWIMPGPDSEGCVLTIALGVIGALIGGFVMSLFGYGGVNGIDLWSILVATLGAVIFLAVFRLIRR
jgi:uncharacterized membrane protein YeaQ/YmgE (transglycosylase-associated protein family)